MMEEQSRRKPRIPLSSEELYYFIKLKKLKQAEKIKKFRASGFYKIANYINVFLAAFLSYCILSILIVATWHKTSIADIAVSYGAFNAEMKQRTISDIDLTTASGEVLKLKITDLYEEPQKNEVVFIGKDLLFNKNLKAKFENATGVFWTLNSVASLTVCVFALLMGCFVYAVNKHFTVNGLLTVIGLFMLAGLYFILI